MNLKDKLELALHEAYIKAYKLAEPSADFDILVWKCRNLCQMARRTFILKTTF